MYECFRMSNISSSIDQRITGLVSLESSMVHEICQALRCQGLTYSPREFWAFPATGSKMPAMLHTNLTIRERTDAYVHARYQHPAWLLLASRRGPLVLSCLRGLFDDAKGDVGFDDALQSLAQALADHANHAEFDIGTADCTALARKELRGWIKRELVVERGGNLYATDALEEAMRFVEALGDRVMTSTASRLSVVQREIESVEASLNPDPKSRAHRIREQIADLEAQLSAVEAGHVDTLDRHEAVERIREIFNLAMSLRADFRRVEDSWREADRALRQSMVGGDSHRGEIMDKLLDGHDRLLDTPEGRVFQGFQQQLSRKIELDDMKQRLRTILSHPFCAAALNQQQHTDLRWLILRLVKESQTVIQARARIERDVKGFLKSGLAAEHHRVGLLLNELFQCAVDMDWHSAALRGRESPLPPLAFPNASLPIAERLRFKSVEREADRNLELEPQSTNLNEIEEEFWLSFAGLDRLALVRDTVEWLSASGAVASISDLARQLPPTHDLESLTVWLAMAREAEVPVHAEQESVEVACADGTWLRFDVPKIELCAAALQGINWEVVGA